MNWMEVSKIIPNGNLRRYIKQTTMSNEDILNGIDIPDQQDNYCYSAKEVLKAMDEARKDAITDTVREVELYKKYAEEFRKLANDYCEAWKELECKLKLNKK